MDEKNESRSLTGKVLDTLVGPIMFALFGVVPLDSQPVSRLVFETAHIADSASLALEGQPLSNVIFHLKIRQHPSVRLRVEIPIYCFTWS